MSKYYKAEDVINAIEEMPNGYNGWSDTFDKAQIIRVLEELPAIDIVECKECRWRDDCSQTVANIEWTVDTMLRWCSDGERIEE